MAISSSITPFEGRYFSVALVIDQVDTYRKQIKLSQFKHLRLSIISMRTDKFSGTS